MKRNLVVAFLVGSLLFGVTLSAVARRDDKLSLQELVERHKNALGGSDRVQKTITRVAHGKVQLVAGRNSPFPSMAGTATFYSKAPNKIKIAFDFGGRVLARGFDGNQAWMKPVLSSSDGVILKTLQGLLSGGCMLHDISVFDSLIAPPQKTEVKIKGTKRINDRETYQVEVKNSNMSAKVFVDAETFLRLKTSVSILYSPDTGGNNSSTLSGGSSNTGMIVGAANSGFGGGGLTAFNIEFDTADFRDVNGVKLPFSYTETMPGYTIKVAIDSYEENVDISDSVFSG